MCSLYDHVLDAVPPEGDHWGVLMYWLCIFLRHSRRRRGISELALVLNVSLIVYEWGIRKQNTVA